MPSILLKQTRKDYINQNSYSVVKDKEMLYKYSKLKEV